MRVTDVKGLLDLATLVSEAVVSVHGALVNRPGVMWKSERDHLFYRILREEGEVECTLVVQDGRVEQHFSAPEEMRVLVEERLRRIKNDAIYQRGGVAEESARHLEAWRRAISRVDGTDSLTLAFAVNMQYLRQGGDVKVEELDRALRGYVVRPSLLLSGVYDASFRM